MGTEHERRFWQESTEYHDLARQYERNVEITHPPFVTSDGIGHRIIYHDVWSASKVTYYEYTGPSV